jgi:hypothetical protein
MDQIKRLEAIRDERMAALKGCTMRHRQVLEERESLLRSSRSDEDQVTRDKLLAGAEVSKVQEALDRVLARLPQEITRDIGLLESQVHVLEGKRHRLTRERDAAKLSAGRVHDAARSLALMSVSRAVLDGPKGKAAIAAHEEAAKKELAENLAFVEASLGITERELDTAKTALAEAQARRQKALASPELIEAAEKELAALEALLAVKVLS